jgi:hypothetical protein
MGTRSEQAEGAAANQQYNINSDAVYELDPDRTGPVEREIEGVRAIAFRVAELRLWHSIAVYRELHGWQICVGSSTQHHDRVPMHICLRHEFGPSGTAKCRVVPRRRSDVLRIREYGHGSRLSKRQWGESRKAESGEAWTIRFRVQPASLRAHKPR